MAKKKIVNKVEEEKIPELKIIEETTLAESPEKLEMPKVDLSDGPTVKDNGLGMDDGVDETLTLEELTTEYQVMREVSYQMIERQYVLEWKVFGEAYKDCVMLQVQDDVWLIGKTQADLKYITSPSKKEAYVAYMDKES